MQGSVTWFNPGRGYGFLKADDGKEFFAHFSGINGDGFKSLAEGQRVEFDIEDAERGPKAVNISVIDNKA